jgi:SAM-dependent methyltransferase
VLDTDAFADPWEQLRLLSDAERNNTLLRLLRARAPGAVVAEVGAGTGIWSLAAAAMGARHVYAIEPSPLHRTISELVTLNGLSEKITVVPAHIEATTPPPSGADLIFSELLNVDPFAEEILSAMDAAARWLAPGGLLAPSRLTLYAALITDREPADERDAALAQLRAVARETGLRLGPLDDVLRSPGPYCYAAPEVTLLGPPAVVCALPLGQGAVPPLEQTLTLRSDRGGAAAGVAVWFEADYGEGRVMSNGPGRAGHWGVFVCGWPHPQPVSAGGSVTVSVEIADGSVVAVPQRMQSGLLSP